VRELDPSTDRDQAVIHGAIDGGYVNSQRGSGAPKERWVATRLCGCREDDEARITRERGEPPRIALFDLAAHCLEIRHCESTGKVAGPRQFDERERIALTLSNDLVAHDSIQRPGDIRQEQGTRVTVGEPGESQLG
jgi:hypothetical protein